MNDHLENIRALAGNPAATLPSIVAAVEAIETGNHVFDQEVRIYFLRNFIVEGILPYLKLHCYRANVRPFIGFSDYDAIEQEVLSADSRLKKFCPDIVVLAVMLEQFDINYGRFDWDARQTRDRLAGILELLATKFASLIVVNSFYVPLYFESAIVATKDEHARPSLVRWLNSEIAEFARRHASQFFVLDWDRMMRVLGEDRSLDYRFWHLYRAPFKNDFLNLYAREIAGIVRALKGKSKKCLVVDCDNTLWGGIIGEDGLDGIRLDRNEYPGRCFFEFQQSILNLAHQGVMVALCSNNNEEDVWEVFDKHPDCLLKRSHLAGWRINWQNKAASLAALSKELNIGADSLVFVDDSPRECMLVKQFLPDVTVLQVPEHLYHLPRLLLTEGLFDTLSATKEDENRTAMYQAESQRLEYKQHFDNINEYLTSLGLAATIHAMTYDEIPRVAQLVGKTNQFNLTTKRYSEAEIGGMAGDPSKAVFTMRVRDKFGDLGLIGVLIAERSGKTALIDTLLMSCRALGRNLELAFVGYCLSSLKHTWDVRTWEAEYRPTKKNQQVEKFWDTLGFHVTNVTQGAKKYVMDESERKSGTIEFIKIQET